MDLGSLISGAGNVIGGLFKKKDGSSDDSDSKNSESGGILSGLLTGPGLSALGKGLGGVAQSDASNRGVKLAAMMAGDNAKLAQQQQRNSDLASLPGQIQKADYLASGGYTPKTNISASGRVIPKFDMGLAPISKNVQNAGSTLEGQLINRLNTPPTYNDYSTMMNPGIAETALNWASPVLGAMGAAKTASTDPYSQLIAMLTNKPKTPMPPAAKPMALSSTTSLNDPTSPDDGQ
jgi:hypothetical protein